MFNHSQLVKLCQYLAATLLICIGMFFSYQLQHGLHIDTNLKTMSPEFAPDSGVQGAIDSLSSSIEKRFTLLLYAQEVDALEDAVDTLTDLVKDGDYAFSVIDELDNFDSYSRMLQRYQFHLVTEKQSQRLRDSSDQQLLATAEKRLYSLESSSQIFPITTDPFGFLNDFILASGDGLNGSNTSEAKIFQKDNKQYYFLPMFFHINQDALDLENQKNIQQQIEQLKRKVAIDHPQINYLHSGIIFFATDAAKKAKTDITMISTGSSIGIFLLLLLTFRSFGALLLPGLSIVFGITLAFATSHILFGSVHIITIVFGAGLIGVVIDYSLHSFFHKSANAKAIQLYKALAFSLFTSVIGYGALAFSDLMSLKRVAFFSATGLVGAWIIVVAAAPLFLRKDYTKNSTFLSYILRTLNLPLKKISGHYLSLFCFGIAVTFIATFFSGFKTSDNPRIFFSPNPELLSQEKQVSELISSYEPGTYIVVRGQSTQEVYQHLATLRQATEKFDQTFGVHQLLPSPEQQLRYYQQLSRIYQKDGLAWQFLKKQGVEAQTLATLHQNYISAADNVLLPSKFFSTMQGSAINLWLEQSDTIYSFILIPKDFDSRVFKSVDDSHKDIFVINTANMVEQSISQQRQSATLLLVLAFILIAGLILVRYRTLIQLRLILVPLNAIVLTLLVLHFANIPLTLFHTMAMFLVLGLGMDYVIFVSEIPDSPDQTLHAVILSALTSLLSFGLLSMSDLSVVSAFGITVLIGNSANLIGSILLANSISHHQTSHRQQTVRTPS